MPLVFFLSESLSLHKEIFKALYLFNGASFNNYLCFYNYKNLTNDLFFSSDCCIDRGAF